MKGGDSAAVSPEGAGSPGDGDSSEEAKSVDDGASVGRIDRVADRLQVHPAVRASAEWCWRLLVIIAAVYVIGKIFKQFDEVLVPVALAILGAAFLVPAVDWLHRRRVPRSLAVVLMMIIALGAISGVLTFVGREFARGFPQLTDEITQTIDNIREWLVDGPLKVDRSQVGALGENVITVMEHNQTKLASGAVATATTATELVTGVLLTIFLMIFFLYGGGQIWGFCTRLIPKGSRERVAAAGHAGFGTLVGYVRATVVVALVDAACIGIGLAVLRVPLALPLATLVFLGAFIPIVGALVSGTVAVAVALVSHGWLSAVIVLALLVAVMQLEGHVLQPFLLGRSVRVHPVAVILGIGAGIVGAGVVGGLLAVPLIAFGNTAVRYLAGHPVVAIGDPDEDPPRRSRATEPDQPRWDRRNLNEVTPRRARRSRSANADSENAAADVPSTSADDAPSTATNEVRDGEAIVTDDVSDGEVTATEEAADDN